MRAVQVIQVLSDVGAGKRGAHEGAKWLGERLQLRPAAQFVNGDQTQFPALPAKYIDNLTAFFQQFLPPLTALYQQPDFPVILSGDHSNAIGIISGLCNAHPNKRIGVIWIDAHADLHTPYTTPSGNLHGMSLAALLREDNLPEQIHQPTPEITHYWQQLKQLAPLSAGIAAADLCFLGLRDFEPQEAALIKRLDIPHYSPEKMRQLGFKAVLAAVKQQFADVDLLYVSFDVDALDSAFISATGTPVAGGFSEAELQTLLTELLTLPNLAAFEITEFNPTLSADSVQYEMVARLFQGAINTLSN